MESPGDPDPGPPRPSPPDRLPWLARGGLVAAALVALAWVALHAAVDRPAVRARIQARALELLRSRLGTVELAEPLNIDWAFRAWMGPLRVSATTPGAEPLLSVERIRIRASLLAALSGRLEPASVRLYGVRLTPGEHGKELDAALERWRSRRGPPGPPAPSGRSRDPVIHLRGFSVAVPWRGRIVVVGPMDVRLQRRGAAEGEQIEADAWLPLGGHLELHLRRSPAEHGWAFDATARLEAADLPAPTRTAGLRAESGVLLLEVDGTTGSEGARATLRGTLTQLRLRGDRLGPELVGPLAASGEAELGWKRATRRIELHRGLFEPLGPLRLEVEGALMLGAEPSFTLSIVVPPVDYRALVAALPPQLAPPAAAPRPPGQFGGSLKLAGPLTPLVGWTVSAALDLAPMRAEAHAAPPSPLLSPFVAHPDGDDGAAVRLGPSSPAYVPIAELPEHVVRAVTTAEDAGFFGHQGFDFAELLDALAAGAQAGRVVRGGSTISQQLAKNLYLSRDRTLARKAREALVTVALEASLPKARLLELYLNLIEWGPGLHGIGPAARHYFGVDARRLTPRQACFLAAIIPSPNRSHGLVAAGLGDRAYRARVDDLLLRLNGFQVLSDQALQLALEEPLRFAFGAPPPVAPPADSAVAPETDEREIEEAPATDPEALPAPSPGGSG
jgi:penicillin-binding protein 1A